MTKSSHVSTRDLAGALRRQAVQAGVNTPAVRGSDWHRSVVDTVGTDGTITTTDGIIALRDEAYQAPAVGDIIRISISSAGAAVAEGRYAGAAAPIGAWTSIPLLAGFTTPQGSFGPAQYRVVIAAGSPRVEMRGSVACSPTVTGQTSFTSALPAAACPPFVRSWTVRRLVSVDTKGVTVCEISSAGVMAVHGQAAPNATPWFVLDGCYYDL